MTSNCIYVNQIIIAEKQGEIMSIREAEIAARQTILSGYRRHSHKEFKAELELFFKNGGSAPAAALRLDVYKDVLAPTPFRAMQNGLICLISAVSRAAIDNGAEEEYSLALGDYYICEVERLNSEEELTAFAGEIMTVYRGLVIESSSDSRSYCLPVSRAIRYINQHINEPCRVGDIAAFLGLHPNYLGAAFKKDVGVSPAQYIRNKKMEEAVFLLRHSEYTITQIGEMLGYCNTAHFSNEFKREFGQTPNSQRKIDNK
jgi:AraC-like DNA-binding protein